MAAGGKEKGGGLAWVDYLCLVPKKSLEVADSESFPDQLPDEPSPVAGAPRRKRRPKVEVVHGFEFTGRLKTATLKIPFRFLRGFDKWKVRQIDLGEYEAVFIFALTELKRRKTLDELLAPSSMSSGRGVEVRLMRWNWEDTVRIRFRNYEVYTDIMTHLRQVAPHLEILPGPPPVHWGDDQRPWWRKWL